MSMHRAGGHVSEVKRTGEGRGKFVETAGWSINAYLRGEDLGHKQHLLFAIPLPSTEYL